MSEIITELLLDTVIKITLNRPSKKNAITQSMYQQLTQILREANENEKIRAVWLCGAGGDFTAGNDLSDFAKCRSAEDLDAVLSFLQFIPQFSKLLLVTLEGVAVGVGCTLLNFADFVYAETSSRFQLPFTSLGLCPEAGSTYFIPKNLGRPKAGPLLYLGQPFTSEVAKDVGLVTEIFSSKENVEKAASELIAQLATLPAKALHLTKRCVLQDSADLNSWIAFECESFLELLLDKHTQTRLQALVR
ncbi:MAG: enoyl-CoA hydratase [Legionellales bacterium]|nr:enoyl-CoA hydratase [Legionellales bacterium]